MEGRLTGDGATKWLIPDDSVVYISFAGSFDGGSAAIEQRINGQVVPLLDGASSIVFTEPEGANLAVRSPIRINLTGSTSPDISWTISPTIEATNQ